MDGPDAHAGQHGKRGLGNHGHVDQNTVALLYAKLQQASRHALHLTVQFGKGVGFFLAGLGGNEHQRRLVRAVLQMPVHRVVAQVGGTAHVPFGKRRLAVIANGLWRGLPVNQICLLTPKFGRLGDGTLVEFGKGGQSGLRRVSALL